MQKNSENTLKRKQKRTHAFFTSSSLRGPEALNPRANLYETKSECEQSDSALVDLPYSFSL